MYTILMYSQANSARPPYNIHIWFLKGKSRLYIFLAIEFHAKMS
jgi:hypothetical protein